MIFQKQIDYIVAQILAHIQQPQEMTFSYDFDPTLDTIHSAELNKDELELMKKLGKDKEFMHIIEKYRLSAAVTAVNATDTQQVAEVRGMVKILDCLKQTLLPPEDKPAFDQITGQPIKKPV